MRTNLVKKKDTKSPLNDSMLDMVIAFDTTGSMNAYIKAVKLQVKELIPRLFKQNPDLRIGIVAFGDYCDMPSKDRFGLEFIQNNPVKDYIEGEDRVLRGYKMQFVSRDGKYKCMDMDIKRTGKETGERYVNINTISHLIYNGVKYVVE